MAAQPPQPPPDPYGHHGGAPRGPYGPPPGRYGPAPADDADFPGPPGGPLPPGWGGAGTAGPSAGVPGRRSASAGPPSAGDRAQRLRRRLIVGVVAGAAAVGVIAGFVWVALDDGPPYADIAECEELLPADAVDTVPGFDGAAFTGVVLTGDRMHTQDPQVVQQAQCTGRRESGSLAMGAANLNRYDPATEEADYASLRRALDRNRIELSGGVETGSAARGVDAYFGSAVADVEVDRLGAGDEGFVITYTNVESLDFPALDEAGGSWVVAQFRDRNLVVDVVCYGTAEMSAEEKLEAAVEMARLIERRAATTGRTL